MGLKFLDWYVKIAVFSALVGGSMELFMIKTGFSRSQKDGATMTPKSAVLGTIKQLKSLLSKKKPCFKAFERLTVLESEKRARENSVEAQAVREALNPWRNQDAEAKIIHSASIVELFLG
ncbi:hypothetical protein NL676_035356 [Syzygium grande]|nr:hypothetical protein NL676_035356 [Syzygium grande]